MQVATLMTPSPAVVHDTDPLSRAAELMRNGHFGLVPVVDDAGHPIGVVTPRDVCVATLDRVRPPQAITVTEAMRPGIVTIEATASLVEAQDRMAQAGVRRLPVVDASGTLVGVISLGAIARAAAYAGHNGNGKRHVELTLARVTAARDAARLPSSAESGLTTCCNR